jgi:general secretion pathway protein E/type IV pilus assembly protein PilB
MAVREESREVGERLLKRGRLTPEQLELVRRRQYRLRIPQHRAVVDLGLVSEEEAWRELAAANHLEFVDLCHYDFPPGLPDEKRFPVKLIHHHRVLPLELAEDRVKLAFVDPPRQSELSNLRLLLNRRIEPVLTTPSCYQSIIRQYFGLGADTLLRLDEDTVPEEGSADVVFDLAAGDDDAAVSAGIARYVDQVLTEALRLGATDIHIEPYFARIKLRYRIDGVLQTVRVPAGLRQAYGALVSRLKIMAGLNIAEKRLPQDGRISMRTAGEEYDLRVNTVPTKHGEAVCLRVLGRQSLMLELKELGLEPAQEETLRDLTRLPQGLVLLTGPTGSGKTTTLYAALAQAYDEGRKIITIEDPVEYQLEGIVQIQAREEVGLTFANGLRAVLRHDPDVVLIGEIRDTETAEIAVRAAQTGHLVFSTLHTNDSISAITRLIEMGIDGFLLGSSLSASIAQRLARRVCRNCAEPDPDLPDEVRQEMAEVLEIKPGQVRATRGRGCVECGHQGTRGRVALYEFFLMDEEIADLLGASIRTGQLRGAARARGWKSIREYGWLKVQQGLTPASEVLRLTHRVRATF